MQSAVCSNAGVRILEQLEALTLSYLGFCGSDGSGSPRNGVGEGQGWSSCVQKLF